jgi:hypothetical protein
MINSTVTRMSDLIDNILRPDSLTLEVCRASPDARHR